MDILFISPFPSQPLYGGAVVRNHHLAHALAQKHQVWASFRGRDGGSQWAGELPQTGRGLRALCDPLFLWRAVRLVRREKLEAVVASSLISGLHGALLKRLTGRRFWMDEHNVEWHCSRRYGFKGWPLVYLLERFIVRSADFVTCVSEEDRTRLIANFRLDPERVRVAPNGVPLRALSQHHGSAPPRDDNGGKRLLFFGVLNYPPNREAVRFLSEEIAPRLPDGVTISVAGFGGDDLAERYPNLEHLGFVDDIHALVRTYDGVVVPITAGGGTRMKILEAVACGCPVVSTTVGAEGLDRDALGEALTIADEAEGMLSWIEELRPGCKAETGPRFEETYDWERIWRRTSPL